jgi:hypothetical protein
MITSNCSLNIFLANTKDDYLYSPEAKDMLSKTIQQVILNSGFNVKKALFIYQAAPSGSCEPFMKDALQQVFGPVTVECILPGLESKMIDTADCIVIGGGSLDKLKDAMEKYGPNIWKRVLMGIPFIGINNGGRFLSSSYIPIPAGICSSFISFPLQFIPTFDPLAGQTDVSKMFSQYPGLKFALCIPQTDEGGILLEDSKAGLAGSVRNDNMGPGQTGSPTTKPLYIYERNTTGGIREVSYSESQYSELPINYM